MPPHTGTKKAAAVLPEFDEGESFIKELNAFSGMEDNGMSFQEDEDGPPVPARVTISARPDMVGELQKVR